MDEAISRPVRGELFSGELFVGDLFAGHLSSGIPGHWGERDEE